jgi:bifunctional non-homologous end joining protein LigD
VIGNGPEFLAHACGAGLEGVMAKRRQAPYRSGRGSDWLKIKCLKEQEVVIGGYTEPEGTRIGLGALLAGVHEGGQLVYVGKVGTGFSNRSLRDLMKRLRALEQSQCPFAVRPTGVGRSHWAKPELVAQVAFGEWTADRKMRHPRFLGLREDKPATEVVREVAASVETPEARRSAATSGQRSPTARGSDEDAVAGVRLTHAGRVLYPSLGTTKRDLARFYESIAEWILPHLKDRPTTLVRCPDGVAKPCFYQKHVGYWAPESVRRVKIREKTKIGDYLVVDSLPALIGLVQIGILEIHTWNSVVAQLERPDRFVIDLDPGPGVAWLRVVEAAREVRTRLAAVGLQSFIKTTGGKGLHVVTPLAPGSTWEDGARFAQTLATRMVRDRPREYLAHMAKAARRGKIFIDYLRNVRGATSVAAYSTRAKPQASVSVPLDWDELSANVHSDRYTIDNLRSRLSALKADPWARYWTARQSLPDADRL